MYLAGCEDLVEAHVENASGHGLLRLLVSKSEHFLRAKIFLAGENQAVR